MRVNENESNAGVTYVCARVETLSTITRMKEESLIALNEAELIAQPLDLRLGSQSISERSV